jgi:uncharacterized DUF497 family protein
MKFEWDEVKCEDNIRRHFLDFADAPEVFTAPMLVELDSRHDYGEPRFTGLGFLRDLIVLLVFAERGNDIIRIISFRRALKYEREKFYAYLKNELGPPEDDVG